MNKLLDVFKRRFKKFLSKFVDNNPRTEQEFLEVLSVTNKSKLLSDECYNMIQGVLEISTMQARDIMVPRSQMVVIEKDLELEEFLPQMVESGHSRFPVIGGNRDEILGIVLAKDMLPFITKHNNKLDIKSLLREAMVIPESKRLNSLLKEFRVNRQHMAIIADEYGGISGLVTIEDILEQIVGEIEDETDIEEEQNIVLIKDNTYHVQALTTIEDFNEFFKINFSDDEFDTFGGLVLNEFGYLPKKNEAIAIDGFKIKVVNADKRRIRLLKVSVVNNTQDKDRNKNKDEKSSPDRACSSNTENTYDNTQESAER